MVLLVGGLSWIAAGLLLGWVAYGQWSTATVFASVGFDSVGEYQAVAGWNAIAAISMVLIGARLLIVQRRDRRGLAWLTVWAGINAVWGAYQIATGEANMPFALATILTAIAGILTFVARESTPSRSPASVPGVVASGVDQPGHSSKPSAAPARRGLIAVVAIVGIVAAVGGVGIIQARSNVDAILDEVDAAVATPRPGTTQEPAQNEPTVEGDAVAIGETVDLLDTNSDPLGSTAVLDWSSPPSIFELPPADGMRYVVAKVRYDAVAPWTYNLFDWAVHDESRRQYEPTGFAPEPALSGGTLSADRSAEGWVGFEVPDDSGAIWLDLQAADGSVIFSVPLE